MKQFLKKTFFIKCQCIENELRSNKVTDLVTLILSSDKDGVAIPKSSLKPLLMQAIFRQRVEPSSLVFSRTLVTGFTPGIKSMTFSSYQLSQPYDGQS